MNVDDVVCSYELRDNYAHRAVALHARIGAAMPDVALTVHVVGAESITTVPYAVDGHVTTGVGHDANSHTVGALVAAFVDTSPMFDDVRQRHQLVTVATHLDRYARFDALPPGVTLTALVEYVRGCVTATSPSVVLHVRYRGEDAFAKMLPPVDFDSMHPSTTTRCVFTDTELRLGIHAVEVRLREYIGAIRAPPSSSSFGRGADVTDIVTASEVHARDGAGGWVDVDALTTVVLRDVSRRGYRIERAAVFRDLNVVVFAVRVDHGDDRASLSARVYRVFALDTRFRVFDRAWYAFDVDDGFSPGDDTGAAVEFHRCVAETMGPGVASLPIEVYMAATRWHRAMAVASAGAGQCDAVHVLPL